MNCHHVMLVVWIVNEYSSNGLLYRHQHRSSLQTTSFRFCSLDDFTHHWGNFCPILGVPSAVVLCCSLCAASALSLDKKPTANKLFISTDLNFADISSAKSWEQTISKSLLTGSCMSTYGVSVDITAKKSNSS